MSRKRPSAAQMGELLSQPNFQRDNDQPATGSADTSTPMLIAVDQIETFDRNPRRAPNDQYAAIKAYIQDVGFNQVLAVTQRPDTDRPDVYMIAVGGNTRLTALQELWQETGDERFQTVWCQVQPWAGESQTLVAHLQDNDLRGDIAFIDRALALQELRAMFETEAGESLSQRAFRDRLRAQGYQVGRTLIGWYDYTVDTLQPLVPNWLATGAGRASIARVYDFQRAFGRAWNALDLGAPNEAQSVFEQVLSRHDSDGTLSYDALWRDLEEELAVSADCDMQRASLELGGALHGYSDSDVDAAPEPPATTDTQDNATQQAGGPTTDTGGDRNAASNNTGKQSTRSSSTTGQSTKTTTTTEDSGSTDDESDTRSTAPGGLNDGAADSGQSSAQSGRSDALPADLKSLRARAWTLASRLAQGAYLGDVVVPIAAGCGYLIGPVPIETQQTWHPDRGRTALCVWWHLATVAEQFARHGNACRVMPSDWADRRIGDAMRQARDDEHFAQWQWTEGDTALFADVPPLEPADIGPLYQAWSDQRWSDWINLVETTRRISHQAGPALWGDHHASNE